jgi:hypothetical protein
LVDLITTKQNKLPSFIDRSVACAIGPSVNPLQNKGTQHVNIVLQWMYRCGDLYELHG